MKGVENNMSVLQNNIIEPVQIDKFKDLNLDKFKDIQDELNKSINPNNNVSNGDSNKELATIKKAGEKEILTPQQFKKRARELKRCKNDILYFCRKYFKIVSLKDGLVTLDPYPKQAELLKFIQDNNRVICTASRQVGKCVQKNSIIRIRNKITGIEEEITIVQFFTRILESNLNKLQQEINYYEANSKKMS